MIVLVGISHHTAPIELRERVALDASGCRAVLAQLAASGSVREVLVLSTCNRVEILAEAPPSAKCGEVVDAITRACRFPTDQMGKSIYLCEDELAVRHLLRVAASLDSLVVGEPQILGQLKVAFDTAVEAGTVGPVLHRVMARARRTAKRVRTETAIGQGQVSVPSVALSLAQQVFDVLTNRRVTLIGSGEMAEAIALLLKESGAELSLLGRNAARTEELSRRCCGTPHGFEELEQELSLSDVVISSTSAPHPIVSYAQVKRSLAHRRGRSLLFVDVAVPRDIEPKVGELDGVYLFNIDDLSRVTADSEALRGEATRVAERIVDEELAKLRDDARLERSVPTIRALYARMDHILRLEKERSFSGRLRHLGDAEREAVSCLLEAVKKRLLHTPATELRRLARTEPDRAEEALELLTQLFSLHSPVADGQAPEPSAPSPESVDGCCCGGDPTRTEEP